MVVRSLIDMTMATRHRVTRRSPARAKQACDLRRYHFTKLLGNGPSNCLVKGFFNGVLV
jgi:hypothetical protein